MSKHPEVLWAQRSSSTVSDKNVIFLTINLPNIIASSLEYTLTSTGLSFKAIAGTTKVEEAQYAFELDFYAEVDPEPSIKRLTSRSFVVTLRKKESKSEFWPRLTKEKVKTPYIKTDFGKWVDEDEQDGNPDPVDDDFGGAGNFPGMPDMPDFSKMMPDDDLGSSSAPPAKEAAESDDSDDDGPPPLEDAEPVK